MNYENFKTEQSLQEAPNLGATVTLVFKSGAVVKLNGVSIGEQTVSVPPSGEPVPPPMSSGLLIMRAVNGDPPMPYKPVIYSFDENGQYSITQKVGNGPQGPVYSTTYFTPNTLLDALIFE